MKKSICALLILAMLLPTFAFAKDFHTLWNIPFGSSVDEVRDLLQREKSITLPQTPSSTEDDIAYNVLQDTTFLGFPVEAIKFKFTSDGAYKSVEIDSTAITSDILKQVTIYAAAYKSLTAMYGVPDMGIVLIDQSNVYTLPLKDEEIDTDRLVEIIRSNNGMLSLLASWNNVSLATVYNLVNSGSSSTLISMTSFTWMDKQSGLTQLPYTVRPIEEYGAVTNLGL